MPVGFVSDKASLLELPPTDAHGLLDTDRQHRIRRSTSTGASSLAGLALNNARAVRRSILKSVGGVSLGSTGTNSTTSPQHLSAPRKSVSFHDLVASTSIFHLALRGLSPKKQKPPDESKQQESRSTTASPNIFQEPPRSLRKSISNYLISRELTVCCD